MMVCPVCDYHFRINARTRIQQLFDKDSFEELNKKAIEIKEEAEIPPKEDYIYTALEGDEITVKAKIDGKYAEAKRTAENEHARNMELAVFGVLTEILSIRPKWGVLTGIRPVKLALQLHDRGLSEEEIRKKLKEERLVSDEKLDLLLTTMEHELEIRASSRPNSVSLYISIPFCPSRCSYCTFTSHSVEKAAKLIPQYVELLCGELKDIAVLIDEIGLHLETVYMGGGTPTVLTAKQLDRVLSTVNESFDMTGVRELTVEAGRPDTITAEKLAVLKKNGVGRISINPQTMDDEVLAAIGRKHTAEDVKNAFALAKTFGFDSINMDLISGLPGDNMEKFRKTIAEVIAMNPDNITLHTLTVKHGANLAPMAQSVFAATADAMNEYAYGEFAKAGYFPYYLYRQKGTVDNLENVGFCKPGKEGIYNIFIMDETHTVLSAGAGGVTKLKAPYDKKIERIFNFKYPYEYIERFELMNERKEQVRNFYEKYPLRPEV